MIKKSAIVILILLVSNFIAMAKTEIYTLQDLNKPEGVLEFDESRLYLVEGTSILIYSLKDFKLLKKFGKKGEGPEEFINNPRAGGIILFVYTDELIINSFSKLSWWTKEGVFKREIKLKNPMVLGFQPFGKNYMGTKFSPGKVFMRTMTIFDANMEPIKAIAKVPHNFQRGKGVKAFGVNTIHYIYKDRLYLAWENDLSIKVYDNTQKELYTIKHKIDRIKIPENIKKDVVHMFKTQVATRDIYDRIKPITFPDYFPAIQQMYVSNDKIYISTYKIIENRTKTEFLIFDLKGKKLGTAIVPILYTSPMNPFPHNVYDGKVYQLVEDMDEEKWKLHVTPIK